MNSIVNMFYGLDNSVENKQIQHSKNINPIYNTPALNQGNNFKTYQNKIKNKIKKDINNVNSKEGFQNYNSTSDSSYQLAEQSKQVLDQTSSGTDNSLQNEYDITLLLYQKLLNKVSSGNSDYINRVSSTNPYLNKLVRWTDPSANGAVMYVTNQGVAKPINDTNVFQSILGVNGCPNIKDLVDITLPWDSSYVIEGTTIPTSPSLVVGPLMTANESCGNEGNNVYVNSLIPTNASATYDGCYADNSSSPVMTFIGGAPATISGIVNGSFSQPPIKNNTYQYITSESQVPSWNFSAVLLNNSSAWGYPTPYPNGNQCCSLQNTEYIEQTLNLTTGSYTLSFTACGRKSQDGPNKIDVKLNGDTFYSVTPSSNVWTTYSAPFTITTSGNNVINFSGTNATGDKSSAIQNISLDSSGVSTSLGTYTYDMCKQTAIDGGYKYFALQNVNTETSTGYCAVSNDKVSATKNGTSYVTSNTVSLWETKTNSSGNTASLTNQGTLTVYNSSGASIYNTPADTTLTNGGYIGCYNDKSTRAMTNTSNNKYYSFDTCKQYAIDGNYKYYGTQNKDKNNNGWCVASNDLTSSEKYGVANNCTTDSSGNYMGGSWSNAIYSTDSTGSYYLILDDDGNMYIYKGTSPDDNQGQIWSSQTSGKQQNPNSLYTADKGKYGQNWIASGSTLSAGDFVGSSDGTIYLIMQTDGNLVLYTSQTAENCQKMKDGNTGGGVYGNALYELSSVGIPDNMGKLAYVDSNSILYPYPDSSIGLSNDYDIYSNFDNAGHDISNSSITNSTVDSCKSACNNMQNCYGFTFDKTNNICYPKDNTMYPKSSRTLNTSMDIYVRQPKITSLPTGVSDKIFNVDSILYDNYTKSDKSLDTSYGISSANSVEKQQLDQLKTRLDQISQQLADNTTSLSKDGNSVLNQSNLQTKNINNYLKEYKNTNEKIKQFASNINNEIVHESDINVLKENYNYLFWSILAVGTVLITMNVTKN